jgi:hypothetical protein
LGFFYPFPYVLGFSDNLFGSAPFYCLFRLLTSQTDTAFQLWFLFGYLLNFFAAYYALRRLKLSAAAAVTGALIFAFALPTSAHAGHVQLHYRFGLPLAITFYLLFLQQKEWRLLGISGLWLSWQFYCGIYMGFFALLLLSLMTMVCFGYGRIVDGIPCGQLLRDFERPWVAQSRQEKLGIALIFSVCLGLMVLLFFPYVQVSLLYGVKRSWAEISSMLPRIQSYFLDDISRLWARPSSGIFSGLPMRHEHQMFVGAVPLVLALGGFLSGSRKRNGEGFILMAGTLGAAILLTLYVGGFSLWYLIHKLPLVSAIRAVTRIDQALLFPVAYLGGIAVDRFRDRCQGGKWLWVVVLPLLIFEFSSISMPVSPKREWRTRLAAREAAVPGTLPENAILFFARANDAPFYAEELDAMWAALRHGVPTLNGYSGIFPPEVPAQYVNDCSEVPRRVLSYLFFMGEERDRERYQGLMKRLVPIGFEDCNPGWWNTPPPSTRSDRIYSAEEFRHLSLEPGAVSRSPGWRYVQVKIRNSNGIAMASRSSRNRPIRLSWRFLDAAGNPTGGWDTRKDLPFDIPAQGELSVRLSIREQAGRQPFLQVSLVQEHVFWGQDIGVQPLTVRLE